MEYILSNISQLPELSKEIFKLQNQGVYLFWGNLGAGKTTLIKQLCKDLRIDDHVSSPTFSIFQEYIGNNSVKVLHADLYRIKDHRELLDLGWYDLLEDHTYIFIEWPEIALGHLPDSYLEIKINKEPLTDIRNVSLSLVV